MPGPEEGPLCAPAADLALGARDEWARATGALLRRGKTEAGAA